MAIHDAFARTTPYEMAFPDEAELEEWIGRIRAEVSRDAREWILEDPGSFLALPIVAEALGELRDPRMEAGEVHRHGLLFFHIFHFFSEGCPLFFLTTRAARHLVESAPWEPGEGERDGERSATGPRPRTPAGYLQLPRNLFWTPAEEEDEEAPPEPVDGFFWSAAGDRTLNVLVVAGMIEGRPGFSALDISMIPLEEAPRWLDAGIREHGPDFESTLPGGELERLYSLEMAGEVLKLLARFFRYMELFPDAASRVPPLTSDEPRRPTATRLTCTRVELNPG